MLNNKLGLMSIILLGVKHVLGLTDLVQHELVNLLSITALLFQA